VRAGEAGAPELETDKVRAFHRSFATGVTIVTAMRGNEPRGLVVNAFSSLTLEPPRVLVCISQTAKSYTTVFRAKTFAVNVLAADQGAIAKRFAQSGGDKFSGVGWDTGQWDAPILEGACAVAVAELESRVHVHTHTIFVGRVIDVRVNDRPPLLYWDGQIWEPERLRPLDERPSSRGEKEG
jgi:flavin reductase (DIM6/NTAB) family NADH-FMN oxidoreductase RutF